MSVRPCSRRFVSGLVALLAFAILFAAVPAPVPAAAPSASGTWRLSGAVTGGAAKGAFFGSLTVAANGSVTPVGSFTDEETKGVTAVAGGALTVLPDRSVRGQISTAGCTREVLGQLSAGDDLIVAGYRETCGAATGAGTLVALKDDGATVYAQADTAGPWHLAAAFLGGDTGTIRAIFKLDALGALLAGGTVSGSGGVTLPLRTGTLPLQADGALGAGSLLTLTGGDTLSLTGAMHPGKKLMGGTVTLDSGGRKSYGVFVGIRPAATGIQADGAGGWDWLGTLTSATASGWDLASVRLDAIGLLQWGQVTGDDGKSVSFLPGGRLAVSPTAALAGNLSFVNSGSDLVSVFLGEDKDVFVGLYAESIGVTATPGILVGLQRTAPEPQPCQAAFPEALALNVPTAGTLAAGDCRFRLDGAAFGQTYTFNGSAGDVVTLAVTSADFWPRLTLSGPGGGIVASVELGETPGLLQLTDFVLPLFGDYVVEVGSLDPAATGSFTLTRSAGALPAGCAPTPLGFPGLDPETVNGTLAATDCASPFGRGALADPYTFIGTAGQVVTLALTSPTVQPKLALLTSKGELASLAEAGPGGTAGILQYRLPAADTYTVLATSAGAGETGAYTLTASSSAACPAASKPLFSGAILTDSLAPIGGTSCPSAFLPEFPADRYTIAGRAGDLLFVDLMPSRGAVASLALALLKPDGGLLAFDQDYLETPGARLRSVVLPASGTYTVEAIATSLGAGNPAAGAPYRISASLTAAPGGPTVTSVAPATAAVGVSVTLTGTNLGVAVGTVTLAQSGGGRVPAAIEHWTNTAVRVTVPVGAVSGTITLTRGDGKSGSGYITIPSPALISLTPTSAALGAAVSILGSNLGVTAGSVTFESAGGTVAATVTSWSNFLVKVTVPPGAVTGDLTLTTADGKSVTRPFTRLAPTITAITPVSALPGAKVTITGTNFGTAQGSVSFVDVNLNPLAAAVDAGTWKNTSVRVTVPAGAESGPVTLSTADLPPLTAGKAFTALPAGPVIGAISPLSAAPGNSVTLSGTRFGAAVGTVTFSSAGPPVNATVTGWSNLSIRVTVPAGAVTGDVTVWPAVGGRAARKAFTVPSPTITALSPASGVNPATVTIAGTHFGTAPGTVNFVDATLAPVAAAIVPGSWKNTSVKVTVPVGAETGPITLTTADGRTAAKLFTVPGGPVIVALSPASGVVGAAVTISGRSLGTAGTVTFAKSGGGTTNAPVVSWAATLVKVTVPADAVTGDVTILPAAGRPARKAFTVPAPTITALAPALGTVGAAVTISGTNFGAAGVAGSVTFARSGGGVTAAAITSWAATVVKVAVPADAVSGDVTLTRADGVTVSKAFTVPAPGLTALTPASGAAGVAVTVSGTNLGVTQGTGGVTFATAGGGTVAAPITSWANTAVKVTVPATAVTGDLTLTRGDGVTITRPFTVPAPTITALAPASGAVGVVVTLGGSFFGATAGSVTFNGSAGPSIPTSWTNTAVKVAVPADAISGDVTLTRADGVTATRSFTVPLPTLSTLVPASGKAGATVVINGANLGAVQGTGTVTFGATPAAVTTWSNTSVKVTVPAGLLPGSLNLVLTRGDGVATTARTFTVLP